MKEPAIYFLDRQTRTVEREKIFGEKALLSFYGYTKTSLVWRCIVPFLVKYSLFSRLYGWWQKRSCTKKNIAPFVRKFSIDPSEFALPISEYPSFDAFFSRKLRLGARSVISGKDVAVLPADARYLVYPHIHKTDGFVVKGKKFSLEKFLDDPQLALRYAEGAMVIARLCPTDYHRFHFPCACVPAKTRKVAGSWYSVNPLALRKKIEIFTENKREITCLHTQQFGEVLSVEVGATCVGTIHQTFSPGEPYAKGEEKGYFSFGGSTLVLLFEAGRILFDQDLQEASMQRMEVRGLMGQSLGRSLTP